MTASNVHAGTWYNWFSGQWTDHTSGSWVITLKDLDAFIVVSIVIIGVSIGGEALWNITRRVSHARLTSRYSSLPLETQRFNDIILASNESALGSAFLMLFRGVMKQRHWYLRFWFWGFLLTAILLGVGVPALAIASSYFLTSGTIETPRVIANLNDQRQHLWIANVTDERAFERDAYLNLNLTLAADAIYTACYGQTATNACSTRLTQSSLPYEIFHELDSCPFSGDVCARNGSNSLYKTFRMETPWLELADIGINSKYDLQLKKAVECAPINASKFCTNCDSNSTFDSSSTYFQFLYGDPAIHDYIYFVNSSNVKGYRIFSTSSIPGVNNIDPRLRRPDGTTTVIWFNAPGIIYDEKISDPIFFANDEVTYSNETYWQASFWVTTLGCVDQMRISNNRTNKMTPWLSPETVTQYDVYEENEERSIGLMIEWAGLKLSIQNILAGRGASALRASRSLVSWTQTSLVQNQTQVEVSAWFATSLAKLQLSILSVGDGDDSFNSTGFIDILADFPFQKLGSLVMFLDGNYSIIKAWGLVALLVLTPLLWVGSVAAEVFCRPQKPPTTGQAVSLLTGQVTPDANPSFANASGSTSQGESSISGAQTDLTTPDTVDTHLTEEQIDESSIQLDNISLPAVSQAYTPRDDLATRRNHPIGSISSSASINDHGSL